MKFISFMRDAGIALAVGAALFVLSCSDDPAAPKSVSVPRYPEATTKEIVIDNLLLSYKDRNIEQFIKLLHDDYIWYNQAGTTPEYYTRSEDIDITRNMFMAALHTHPDENLWLEKLNLAIYQSAQTWAQVVDIAGVPCVDCWETTRDYYLILVMDEGAMTLVASDYIKFIVQGVDVSGTKVYRLLRADDIDIN